VCTTFASATLSKPGAHLQFPLNVTLEVIKLNKQYSIEYGETLLDYAFDMLMLRETCGVNHAEFIFVRTTEHLKEYPELKGWFIGKLKSTLENNWLNVGAETKRPNGYIPGELVEYIAHTMKWKELKEIALNELEKHKNNQVYLMDRNLPSSILEALENDWEDIEFYPSLQ